MTNNNEIELCDKLKILVNKINIKNINIDIIQKNIKKIMSIYTKIKVEWNMLDLIQNDNKYSFNKYKNDDSEFKKIHTIITNTFLKENKLINNYLKNISIINHISWLNINFYWMETLESKKSDFDLAFKMFKITTSLNRYVYGKNDNICRIVIWVPINSKRNYTSNIINQENLTNTNDNFEAFVASGLTFGSEPKITIITRYEEIEKLLIHELIHNFNLDGSIYHNKLKNVVEKYKNIKHNKNYHYEYSIYESYTELLATYLYLLFINININQIDVLKEKLLGQIIIEIIYSYNLIANLIKLNGYKNYKDFLKSKVFMGDICIYEYYYIKALLYNNYILKLGFDLNEFSNIYIEIIEIIKKNNIKDDVLMINIYDNFIKINNFKYIMN